MCWEKFGFREHIMGTRTRIWVLILAVQTLHFLPLSSMIYQFLFSRWEVVCRFSIPGEESPVLTPDGSGQLYLLLPLLEDGCLWISRAGRCGQVQGRLTGLWFIQGGSELQLVFWFHLEVRPGMWLITLGITLLAPEFTKQHERIQSVFIQ